MQHFRSNQTVSRRGTRRFSFVAQLALFSALSLPTALATAQAPGGAIRTWSGAAGNGQWGDPANWGPAGNPQPVPGKNDKAVIPPDKGTIKANKIDVHQLEVQGTNGGGGTTITSDQTDKLNVNFGDGGMQVGAGNSVRGLEGDGKAGGAVNVTGSGTLTNDGVIRGGNGTNSTPNHPADHGGGTRVRVPRLVNNGTLTTGNGGNQSHPFGCPPGGLNLDGGPLDVEVTGTTGNTPGTIAPGHKGTNSSGQPGGGRDGRLRRKGISYFGPSDSLFGSDILLKTSASLDFSGASAGAVTATGAIRIDAAALDFTGIPAGTQLLQARDVCFSGALLLDPGVSVQSYCGSATLHFGNFSATEFSQTVFGPNGFDDADGAVPPSLWNVQTLQGNAGFRFDNPTAVPLHPNMGCTAAVIDAGLNGPGPLVAVLDTPPTSVDGYEPGPFLLEWTQWFQPSPGSHVDVIVVADGVPTPVFGNAAGTPPFDFVQIDVTPLVATADEFFVRFQYSGTNQGFWVVDDVAVRVPDGPLPGQAPQPGVSVLDANDARNANNVPVYFGEPGPYFTDVSVGEMLFVHVETAPNQFVFLVSGFTTPDLLLLPGIGQLDLDQPLLVGSYFSDPLGSMDLPFLVPPAFQGLSLGLQAAVTHPTQGIVATNAVEIRFD